jgi:O-antigen/teichoic acid export membrane protein
MSLRRQATSLAIMHAADVVQPLLILPYAGRMLGAHEFGEYAYAMSIGQFAATFVEYGFHWTAQRSAAAARHEPKVIALLFADVLMTKLALCFVVTLVGLAAAGTVLAISRPMFLCAMLIAFGGVLFPGWLLIGLERAWQAAVATVVARILATIGFLILVRSPEQVAFAVMSQAAIPLVSGLVTLPFIASVGLAGLRAVSLSRVSWQLRKGWRGFLYSFVERTSMTLPMLLVQHFGGYTAAGQYSVAEKFVSATRPFFRILSDTFLPRIAYHARHDPQAGLRLIWLSLSTLVVGAAFSLGLLVVAPMVIVPIFGASFAGAIPIVRWLAVVPLLLNLSACTANLYMFNYGHERAWASVTAVSLLALLAVAFGGLGIGMDAIVAVCAAVIAKEAVIAVVSAGFFVAFGVGQKLTALSRSVYQEMRVATGSAEPVVVPSVAMESDQRSAKG